MMVCIQTEDQQAAEGAISRREPKRPFLRIGPALQQGRESVHLAQCKPPAPGVTPHLQPLHASPQLPLASPCEHSLLSGHFATVSSLPPLGQPLSPGPPCSRGGAIPSPCSALHLFRLLSPTEVMCCPHREGWWVRTRGD